MYGSAVPPVLVVACLGYALLGSLAALVAHRVFVPPTLKSNHANHSE